METSNYPTLKEIFTFRWNPNRDLAVVALSWVLVVASLSMSTFVIGQQALGGMGYFLMYAIVGATLCGIGIPLYWMTVVKNALSPTWD